MVGTAKAFLSIVVKMHLEMETLLSLLKRGIF